MKIQCTFLMLLMAWTCPGVCASEPFADDLPGPVLSLRLNESAGATTFVDASGNGNDGTCPNGQACPVCGIQGFFDNACSFNGNDQFILVSNYPHTGATAGTSMMSGIVWVYATALTGIANIVRNDQGNGNKGSFALFTTAAGLLTIDIQQSNGTDQTASDTTTLPLNQWNQCAFTVDGSADFFLYRNGKLVGSGTYNGTLDTSLACLGVGASVKSNCNTSGANPDWWEGYIQEFSLYNRQLTRSEITKDYERKMRRLELQRFESVLGLPIFRIGATSYR
jgi:Concanavalin A-like lectin/glucanases superfamily